MPTNYGTVKGAPQNGAANEHSCGIPRNTGQSYRGTRRLMSSTRRFYFLRQTARTAFALLLSLLLLGPAGPWRTSSVRVEENSSSASEELQHGAAPILSLRGARVLNRDGIAKQRLSAEVIRCSCWSQLAEHQVAGRLRQERSCHNGCGTFLLC